MTGLQQGDRIPNFRRPDHTGVSRTLYDMHHGQAITLIGITKKDAANLKSEIRALNTLARSKPETTFVGVLRGTPEECTQLARECEPAFTLLADDGSLLNHIFDEHFTETRSVTACVFDNNLRVLARIEQSDALDETGLAEAIRRVYAAEPCEKARTVSRCAPVLMIPRVLNTSFCNELIDLFDKDGGKPSGVFYFDNGEAKWSPDPNTKIRKDYYVNDNDPINERIKNTLVRRVLPEIQLCFNYTVTQHERFKLICYDSVTGGYFRPHRDNVTHDAAHRRFAMTINLNTGNYKGGELRFPEYGPDLYEAERGGAIIFSCSLVHEAMPVTAGKRYAMLGFFFGDKERRQVIKATTRQT